MFLFPKKLSIVVVVIFIIVFFGVFRFVAYTKVSSNTKPETFVLAQGDDALMVAKNLYAQGLIGHPSYFLYYFWEQKLRGTLIAGTYLIVPKTTVPEISHMFVQGDVMTNDVKITFPEGWTSIQMAERLTANGLDGGTFLEMIASPSEEIKKRFDFVSALPRKQSLEGYIFPDTYIFTRDIATEDYIVKMLANFDRKFTNEMRAETLRQERTIHEVVTLASIIEQEVRSEQDRKIVSGIFQNRLKVGQALQSDATVRFALGETKVQHSLEDIKIASPYNTYENPGLPPGPITNPGSVSLNAALFPTDTSYNFFLNNPETGQTVFAETFEQHKLNKAANGL